MKRCNKCKELKLKSCFGNKTKSKDGLEIWCKDCKKIQRFDRKDRQSIIQREWYNLKKIDKKYIKNKSLIAKFGISLDQYESMLLSQGSKCAICLTPQNDLSLMLCVDHDHSTGKIRGLLCHKCNTGIGLLGDSIDNLSNACIYLKQHA